MSAAPIPCQHVVVGEESADNLRLSLVLKKIYGQDLVARLLDHRAIEPWVHAHQALATVICLDLFSFDLNEVTKTVGLMRQKYPRVVFNLYVDHDEFRRRESELSKHWQERFRHYFKTYKESSEIEFEPIVRASLQPSQAEALENMNYGPLVLTPLYQQGLVESPQDNAPASHTPTAFMSYSRGDWDGFVSGLATDLARAAQPVWIDQKYIVGGDDWLDAIGEALRVCDTLLLVLSPEALNSRYVKMEYRYFFRQDKPIIPILCKRVPDLPFELATLHYIDSTQLDRPQTVTVILDILSRHRATKAQLRHP